MRNTLFLFFQIVIASVGIAALAFLLWEPHVEGRNAHATLVEIYFHDPFLAYVYAGSLAFFLGLFRAFQLLGDARKTGAFSWTTVKALRTLKYCALTILGFVAGGFAIIARFGDPEDRPAGFMMVLGIAFVASAVAVASAKFGQHLETSLTQSAPRQS